MSLALTASSCDSCWTCATWRASCSPPRLRRARTPPSSPSPRPAARPLHRLRRPLRGDQPLHLPPDRSHRPRERRATAGQDHPAGGAAAALRSVRAARPGAGGVRRQHPARHARHAPLRAGRRAPRPAAGRRQPARRARDLPRHPRPRRVEEIASLLGQDPVEARRSLGELVYHDPQAGLVPAAEYLSGDVRSKLATARQALTEDPDLQVNVAALERVLPADLGVEDVEPRLGAAWIDAATHQQFLAEILDDDTVKVEHPGGAIWAVHANNRSVRATSEWGTGRMPAAQIAKAAIEQRPIQVTDEIDDGERVRRVVNPTETTAAQEKAQAMQERFAEWCFEQPDRASRLSPSTTAASTASSCATTPPPAPS